jgi:hypothetical protein
MKIAYKKIGKPAANQKKHYSKKGGLVKNATYGVPF